MAKHQKKTGAGVALLGIPDELVKRLVADRKAQQLVVDTIINEGPPHKQVYSALLLKTLFVLVKQLEQKTGKKCTVAEGIVLSSEKDEIEIPVPLVTGVAKKKDREAIAEAVAHSPAHEIAAFNILLQGMEWCTQVTAGE